MSKVRIDYGYGSPYAWAWLHDLESWLPLIFLLLVALALFRLVRAYERRSEVLAHEEELCEELNGVKGALARVETRLVSVEQSRDFADSLLLQRERVGEPRRLM